MTSNPYTAPNVVADLPGDCEYRTRCLKQASTLYRWMGWTGIVYFCIAFPLGLWSELRNPPFRIDITIGATLVTVFFISFFAAMIRLAQSLRTDLTAVYHRTRWTGLLAGAFGFPFLTIPAFYSLWLIGRAHPDIQTAGELSDASAGKS